MVTTKMIFAASSVFGLSSAVPLSAFSRYARSNVERADGAAYKVYAGDGSAAKGWPEIKDWKSFDDLWALNSPIMGKNCLSGTTPNTQAETNVIKDAVQDAGKASGLDPRFLLVAVMQESNGCVRVGTTYSPAPDNIRNPGLLQDYNGKASCNDPKAGIQPQSPCPDTTIKAMVSEGSGATNDGGFKQHYADDGAGAPTTDAKYYWAARGYNSGRVTGGNLGQGVATHCYASDIANRLMGWLGEGRTCDEATIGTLTTSEGSSSAPVPTQTSSTSTPTPSKTGSATAPTKTGSATTPTQTGSTTTPTKPATTSSGSSSGSDGITSSPSGPKGQGAASNCTGWYTVKSGDSCGALENTYGLPTGTVQKLNTGLNAQCTNLLIGDSYCLRNV